MNKVYEGKRTELDCEVTVDGKPLDLRHDLRNHSPTGAQWGYQGSGPAQLSLAILADALGDELAQRHYQLFKRERIATIDGDAFIITSAEVPCWIAAVLSRREADDE